MPDSHKIAPKKSATAAQPHTHSQTHSHQPNRGEEKIIVKGARTHNLKNITVEMPRNKMIAITGLSGSGKSSLAFDTIFAEGQRRYVESLSAYARQFLHKMQKPDVDEIIGLSPAISIDQKSRSNNPRSTVATITEIYDYLRILYARVGKPHCLVCGRLIHRISKEEILQTVIKTVTEKSTHARKVFGVDITTAKITVYAPVVVGRKGEYYQMLYDLLGKGYDRVRIDGKMHRLRDQIIIEKNKKHDIDVLVDEIFVSEFKDRKPTAGGSSAADNARERLSEALERAVVEADGLIKIAYPGASSSSKPRIVTSEASAGLRGDAGAGNETLMSVKFMCPYDGFSYPEVEPRLFSFNSPYGACPACNGLGTETIWTDDPCKVCEGKRLRPEALHVKIGDMNIVDVVNLSIEKAVKYFEEIKLTDAEKEIAKIVLKEIEARLLFMVNVGIEYLTLDRRAHTLSGGEAQRIRLASQLGSGLVGALYVLDEPTIGLHQRDNDKLIKTLIHLRDIGNTIIVVEHDEDTMFASDYIIDIGPGAGVHGGKVVVSGYLDELLTAKTLPKGGGKESLTLSYLRGDMKIDLPKSRRQAKGKIMVRGGNIFNIKDMNVDLPLGVLNVITGVSGSGKSSFM
jgi:excinuclease ABC subunit A